VVQQRDSISLFAPELADTATGMDPANFETLSRLEVGHFWFVARNQLIVGLAAKYFPQARSFLEVGCGTGMVLTGLAASRRWDRLVGSELHPAGLNFARKRLPSSVELVQMDARNIPAQGVFDVTGAFDVIEHVVEDEAVIRGMRAATQPKGGIIIAVPQHPWLWSESDVEALHQRRYRRGELEQKLVRNGYEILFSSSFTSWLLPLMVVSRLKPRGKRDEQDPFREFTLSPKLNEMLTRLLRAEVRTTLAGSRWPVGGSRVVVGRAV
jgi:SAM-dependent methyltransferase